MSAAAKLCQIAQDAFKAGDYGAVIKYAGESLDQEYSLSAFKYFCLGNLKIGNFDALRDLVDVIDESDPDLKILKFDYHLYVGYYDAAAEIARNHYVKFGFDSVSEYFCSAFNSCDRSEDASYAQWTQEKLIAPLNSNYGEESQFAKGSLGLKQTEIQ